MAGIYSKVADLPDVLQRVLREVGYGRKDVELVAATSYSTAGSSGDGYRAFTAAVDLREGTYKVIWGSWGGANIFNPQNAVDLDTQTRDLPVDGAVVQGLTGGGRPVYASITLHPDNLAKLLPPKAELTEQERAALDVVAGITSSYRDEEFQRLELGRYGADNPLIRSLVEKGLVKVNAAGAVSITTDGRNAKGR